jgi:hypothetical protein
MCVLFGRKIWPQVIEISTLDGVTGYRITNSTLDADHTNIHGYFDLNKDGNGDLLFVNHW